jgi:hypothetical protein
MMIPSLPRTVLLKCGPLAPLKQSDDSKPKTMTDPPPGTDATECPPDSAVAAPAAPAPPEAVASTPPETGPVALVPGQRWRAYTIGRPVVGAPAGTMHASVTNTLEDVIIRIRPITDATTWRRQAWDLLAKLPEDKVLGGVEAVEDGWHRYEVTRAPTGSTLRDWVACRHVGLPEIERLVQDVADILSAMHEVGLVHLRLQPDTLFQAAPDSNQFVLGGLDEATLFNQSDLIPAEVDPLYAPPEAAGLFRHSPGVGLCAWDWWSLGRVVQECIVGRHVFSLIMEREVLGHRPDVRPRAESLLLERDPSGLRAGAVEVMPENTNVALRLLLRGLLASSRDGRWQAAEVQRWLRREPVPDRYELSRSDRLFIWRKRAFTVTEAAEFFVRSENWADGEAQLFAPAEERDALVNFLADVPAHRTESELVQRNLELLNASAWDDVPPPARRTAIVALTWLALAGKNKRATLRVRGRKVDAAGLRQLLSGDQPDEIVPVLQAFLTPVFMQWVEPLDAAAARFLAQLSRSGAEAWRQGVQQGWLRGDDFAGAVQLFRSALEADKEIAARLERVRTGYAASRDARLSALMRAEKPERWAQVLLAHAGDHAEDFGLVTHTEWNRQRHGELAQRAGQLATALFWLRLWQLLRGSPVLLGSWGVYAAIWVVPVAVAGAAREWSWAAGCAGCAVAFRIFACWRAGQLVRRYDPSAASWGWNTRSERCLAEVRRILGQEAAPGQAPELLREFRALAAEAAGLPLVPPARLPVPPILGGMWLASGLGALVALVATLLAAATLVESHQSVAAKPGSPVARMQRGAAGHEPANGRPLAVDETGRPVPMKPVQLFEVAADGFGWRLRGPLKVWDLPPPPSVPSLPVNTQLEVSPAQAAWASVSAFMLLEPYSRRAVNVILAVQVPVDGGTGLVLLDSQECKLADPRLFLVSTPPEERRWYRLGDRQVVYLGVPRRGPFDLAMTGSAKDLRETGVSAANGRLPLERVPNPDPP